MEMLLTIETFDFDLEGFTYHHFDNIDDHALWAHVEYLCETKNFFSLATLNKDHLREYLENKGITYLEAEVKMIPQNYVKLDSEGARKMSLIVEHLEDLDDVQDVWHNWEEEE